LNKADKRQTKNNTPEQSFSEIAAFSAVSPDKSTPPDKPVIMLRRIGSTTYKIAVHFSQTSKETVSDKISRMIHNEISTGTAVID